MDLGFLDTYIPPFKPYTSSPFLNWLSNTNSLKLHSVLLLLPLANSGYTGLAKPFES